MVNYRIFNAKEFTAGQSGSLDRAWGVMVNTPVCSGSLYLEGLNGASHSVLKLEYLPKNTPIPCYLTNMLRYDTAGYVPNSNTGSAPNNPTASVVYSVEVTAGSIYLLA